MLWIWKIALFEGEEHLVGLEGIEVVLWKSWSVNGVEFGETQGCVSCERGHSVRLAVVRKKLKIDKNLGRDWDRCEIGCKQKRPLRG